MRFTMQNCLRNFKFYSFYSCLNINAAIFPSTRITYAIKQYCEVDMDNMLHRHQGHRKFLACQAARLAQDYLDYHLGQEVPLLQAGRARRAVHLHQVFLGFPLVHAVLLVQVMIAQRIHFVLAFLVVP